MIVLKKDADMESPERTSIPKIHLTSKSKMLSNLPSWRGFTDTTNSLNQIAILVKLPRACKR